MALEERSGDALARPGSYALVFECKRTVRLTVGALGRVRLDAGEHVYVGSAFGPGGLGGRLRHHLRPIVRPRWHVDYLRPRVRLLGAWCATGPRRLEHVWAAALGKRPGLAVTCLGFGSSDCDCAGHLFHCAGGLRDRSLGERLERASEGIGVDYWPRVELAEQLLG